MRHRKWVCAISILGALVWSESSFASALPEMKGHWFLAPEISYYTTNRYWDTAGVTRSLPSPFIENNMGLYGLYGLTSDTTLTFKTMWEALREGPFTNSGFTSFQLGLNHGVYRQGPWDVSLYGDVIVPNDQKVTAHYPQTGYNRFGFEGGVLFGGYFNWGFIDSGIGYRLYAGYPSNQIRAYVTNGLDLSAHLQGLVSLYGTFGTNPNALGPTSGAQFGDIAMLPYYRLLQASLSLRWFLGPHTSVLPTVTIPVWGRNTGQGYTVGVSLWTSFS